MSTTPAMNARQFHGRLIKMGSQSSKKLLEWLMSSDSSERKRFADRLRKLNLVGNGGRIFPQSKKSDLHYEGVINPKSKHSRKQRRHIVDGVRDKAVYDQ